MGDSDPKSAEARIGFVQVVRSALHEVMNRPTAEISEDTELPPFPAWRTKIFIEIKSKTNIDCTGSNAKNVKELAAELAAKQAAKAN